MLSRSNLMNRRDLTKNKFVPKSCLLIILKRPFKEVKSKLSNGTEAKVMFWSLVSFDFLKFDATEMKIGGD